MELLTVQEAADYLKVHPETIRIWLRDGKMKGVKAGYDWRIYKADLELFLAASNGNGKHE